MGTGIYGTTAFTATFTSGVTETVYAFDIEGAEYIAANTAALYGWGQIATIGEVQQ